MAKLAAIDACRLLRTIPSLSAAAPFIKYNRCSTRHGGPIHSGRPKGGYYSRDEIMAELGRRGISPDQSWEEPLCDPGSRYCAVLYSGRSAQHAGDFRTKEGALSAPAFKKEWGATGLIYDREGEGIIRYCEPVLIDMWERRWMSDVAAIDPTFHHAAKSISMRSFR